MKCSVEKEETVGAVDLYIIIATQTSIVWDYSHGESLCHFVIFSPPCNCLKLLYPLAEI